MAYRKISRDQALEAFVEGSFFGFVTALLVVTLSRPSVKTVTIGFFGYVLFLVLRGLLDYNRKDKSEKGRPHG
jgi:hypothetical protein